MHLRFRLELLCIYIHIPLRIFFLNFNDALTFTEADTAFYLSNTLVLTLRQSHQLRLYFVFCVLLSLRQHVGSSLSFLQSFSKPLGYTEQKISLVKQTSFSHRCPPPQLSPGGVAISPLTTCEWRNLPERRESVTMTERDEVGRRPLAVHLM